MSVYVDDPIWPFGRMMMCHMFADSEEELVAMARKIGVQAKWIQRNSRLLHFDVCKSKRVIAIGVGAIEVTRRQVYNFMKTGNISGLALTRSSE